MHSDQWGHVHHTHRFAGRASRSRRRLSIRLLHIFRGAPSASRMRLDVCVMCIVNTYLDMKPCIYHVHRQHAHIHVLACMHTHSYIHVRAHRASMKCAGACLLCSGCDTLLRVQDVFQNCCAHMHMYFWRICILAFVCSYGEVHVPRTERLSCARAVLQRDCVFSQLAVLSTHDLVHVRSAYTSI